MFHAQRDGVESAQSLESRWEVSRVASNKLLHELRENPYEATGVTPHGFS